MYLLAHSVPVFLSIHRAMAALTPLLLLLYTVSFLSASVADDGAAILALAKAFRHPPSDWSTTVSTGYCLWTGVRCTSGRVTSISLAAKSLSGGIAPEISTLSELKSVALQRNKLSGNIPSFAKLSSLQEIYMDENLFVGVEIGAFEGLTSLEMLSLSHNANMTAWSFPSELVDSTSLTTIYLDNTSIFGVLPDIFDSFTSLQNLRLSYNNITGPLPPSLAKTSIQNLWINDQDNGMSGTIQVLSSMTSLSQAWFQKNQFVGPIPDLSKSHNLFDLQLRDNQLTGIVPPTLLSLRSLKNLSLDNNKFYGPLPSFPPEVKVSVENNNLCTTKSRQSYSPQVMRLLAIAEDTDSGASSSNSSGESLVIVGVIVVVLVILAILGFAVYKFVTKKKYRADPENPHEIMLINGGGGGGGGYTNGNGANSWDRNLREGRIDTIPMDVLHMATNSFCEDNILGRGGFGVVYSGELHNGTKVAIKRMNMSATGNKGMKEFQAEIAVLTKVRHRHLVALLGYCVNEKERLLVYEYMPQGNLGHHLFEWRDLGYSPLTWEQRVCIALDMARGVEYLHNLAQESFIHRDLKPYNILLGNDMRAKVADFGLVKNAVDGIYSDDSKLKGTFGYLAPEYTSTGKSTDKVDVYAVGVILMEMITGRKALDHTLPEEKSHLATWFSGILTNKDRLQEELDQSLKPDEETMDSIHKIAELARHCTAQDPEQRPDMGQAVYWLRSLVETWKQSRQEEESLKINAKMSVPQALHRPTCQEEDNFEIDVNMGLDQEIKRLLPQALQRPSCQEEVIVVNDKFMSGPNIQRRIVPDTDTLSDKHGSDMGQAVNELDPLVKKCKLSPEEENESFKIDVNIDLHQDLQGLSCQRLKQMERRLRKRQRHIREAIRRHAHSDIDTHSDTDALLNTDADKQRPDMGRDVLGPLEKCKQSCQEEESLEIDENMDVPEDIWRPLHSDTDTDPDTDIDKQRPDMGRDVLGLVEKCKQSCQEEEERLEIDENMDVPEDIWRPLHSNTDPDTYIDKQRPDMGRDVFGLVEKCKQSCQEEESLEIDENMDVPEDIWRPLHSDTDTDTDADIETDSDTFSDKQRPDIGRDVGIPDAVWKHLLSDTDTLSDTFSDALSGTLSDAFSDTLSDGDIHSDKESL